MKCYNISRDEAIDIITNGKFNKVIKDKRIMCCICQKWIDNTIRIGEPKKRFCESCKDKNIKRCNFCSYELPISDFEELIFIGCIILDDICIECSSF